MAPVDLNFVLEQVRVVQADQRSLCSEVELLRSDVADRMTRFERSVMDRIGRFEARVYTRLDQSFAEIIRLLTDFAVKLDGIERRLPPPA